MEKIPQGRYTREFWEEAARLVLEDGRPVGEVFASLSLPKSTLENWVRALKAGELDGVGKNRKPLTEVELELARVKRESSAVITIPQVRHPLLRLHRGAEVSEPGGGPAQAAQPRPGQGPGGRHHRGRCSDGPD